MKISINASAKSSFLCFFNDFKSIVSFLEFESFNDDSIEDVRSYEKLLLMYCSEFETTKLVLAFEKRNAIDRK